MQLVCMCTIEGMDVEALLYWSLEAGLIISHMGHHVLMMHY